jgi:hypothetical protein
VAILAGILLLAGGPGGDDDSEGDMGAIAGASDPITLCGSQMIEPAPGSTLAGETVTFRWTPGCGMTKYDLWVGCAPGAVDYFNPDDGQFTEATVAGLPLDGGPVYLRLTSSNGTDAGTFVEHYEYRAAKTDDSEATVFVPGDTEWMDSGFNVTPDAAIRLEVCGQVEINAQGFPAFPPGGDDQCPGMWRPGVTAPDLPCWGLIGRIGEGQPFLVGSALLVPSSAPGGVLYLGVNDDDVSDNGGGFRVTVWETD